MIHGQHIIRNPNQSWFPALTWAMFLIDDRFQNLDRSNLGWSAKNMRDSICFRVDVLRQLGWGEGLPKTIIYDINFSWMVSESRMSRRRSVTVKRPPPGTVHGFSGADLSTRWLRPGTRACQSLHRNPSRILFHPLAHMARIEFTRWPKTSHLDSHRTWQFGLKNDRYLWERMTRGCL